jgi:hypothetical protein
MDSLPVPIVQFPPSRYCNTTFEKENTVISIQNDFTMFSKTPEKL